MPVRELLQALFKVRRDRAIYDGILFLIFLVLFFVLTRDVHNVDLAWSTNEGLMDLYLDEEFQFNFSDPDVTPYKKNFFEIMTIDEIWQWIDVPLLNGLYTTEYFNEEPLPPDELGYVLGKMQLVGGVQLRQVRVRNDSCVDQLVHKDCTDINGTCVGRYGTKSGTCYAKFSVDKEERSPLIRPRRTYHWSDGHSPLYGLYGFEGGYYGTGGYVVTLPLVRSEAEAVLEDLNADRFIDQGTRAFIVDFTLYNTATQLASAVRIQFEMFFTSFIKTSFRFYTFRVAVYESANDKFRAAIECLWVLFLVFFLVREAREMWISGAVLYLSSLRNLIESIIIALGVSYIIGWTVFVTDPARVNFDAHRTEYTNYFDVAQTYYITFLIAGMMGLLTFLKLFKYLGVSRRMNAIWLTLARARYDLATFMAGVIILILGFAFLAHFLFGGDLEAFHNMASSLSSLLRFALGDFSYQDLQDTRPILAGIYFALYIAIIFLVAFNLFIGIVTAHFDTVHDELKTQDRWKETAHNWEDELSHRAMLSMQSVRLFCRRHVGRRCCPCWFPEEPAVDQDNDTKPNPVLGSRASMAALLDLTSDEARLEELKDDYARWQRFFGRVAKCDSMAWRNNHLDLYEHFATIYQHEPNSDSLFVGAQAISLLIQRPSQAEATPHVEALRMVEAYHNLKSVEMQGTPTKWEPPAETWMRMQEQVYHVIKVNFNGVRQRRRLWLDRGYTDLVDPPASSSGARRSGRSSRAAFAALSPEAAEAPAAAPAPVPAAGALTVRAVRLGGSGGGGGGGGGGGESASKGEARWAEPQLYNFDPHMRLKKRLPLRQLVQIERFRTDRRRLMLVFSSQGATENENAATGGLETSYMLLFPSARRREEFLDELLDITDKLIRWDDEEDLERYHKYMRGREGSFVQSGTRMPFGAAREEEEAEAVDDVERLFRPTRTRPR